MRALAPLPCGLSLASAKGVFQMPARREALQRLDAKLKELARRVPEGEELYSVLLGLSDDPAGDPKISDRMAALSAAAYIDHALQVAITVHLKPGLSESESKAVFDGARFGPLGSLSAKTTVAQALGIIDQKQREDLDTIRNIRNAFAHTMGHIQFSDDPIPELCRTLNIAPTEENFKEVMLAWPNGPCVVYVTAVAQLFLHLYLYHPDDPKYAPDPLPAS
jgi:hypothetical protein